MSVYHVGVFIYTICVPVTGFLTPRNFIKLYPTLVLFEQSNCIDWQNLLYTVTDQDVVFLVPDSC
jgi:hypothetical protein